jgi:CRISPR-associated endonuclease/helicase Cas3
LMDGISPCGNTPFRDRLVRENDGLHYAEVIKAAEEEHISISSVSDTLKQCGNELRKFIETCKANNLNVAFMLHLLTKSVFSCLVDSDRYNAYCFEINKVSEIKIQLPPWEEYAQRLEQKISTFSATSGINIIRREISEKCLCAANRPKGIYRLDVPTGGGKTLSSLRFALNHARIHEAEHVIYVIPYLSVLEQTAKDIKKALQFKPADSFILEHHSNLIISDDPEEAQAYRLLTDRWDSPIIITTMVQFLESIYSSKSSDLRKFHNMGNAVFIFDEVQSLPLKCTYLFNEAVNYLYYCAGCSILLCTATQPPLNETEKPIDRKSVV